MYAMHSRSLRDDALDVVRHLVTVIGPRGATSLAEAQAAAYVDGRLRRAGMRVTADTFRAPTSLGLTFAIVSLLGILAALLTHWLPFPSLLLALWGLALVIRDGLVPLPVLAAQRDSQNIVGTRACEKPPCCRVVLLAPLDSLPNTSRLGQFASPHRLAIIGRISAFSLLALLALLHLLNARDIWWYGQALPAAYLLITMLPLRTNIGVSPGGAGALAVLLSSAERLNTLRSVELWTVALGATATGNNGLRNLLERYPFPRDETLFIALEAIDHGYLTYASREGVLKQSPADSLLTQLAATVDADDPLIDAEPRPYRNAPSIVAPLHTRGYRALTLRTHTHTPGITTSDNVLDSFDPRMLERATRLLVGIVKQLDNIPQTADQA